MATVIITLYQPVIRFMRGWDGDIGRSVSRLCTGIAAAQRIQAPKKTGKLVASIKVGPKGAGPLGIQTTVGANPSRGPGKTGYAYWTSEGAKPHIIRPKATNRHGMLVFFWAKAGHVVHLRIVHHPGIRNPTHWVMHGADAGMGAWR